MSTFALRVVTPEGEKFKGEAEKILFRASDGEVCIMANHTDYIAAVDICKVYILDAEDKDVYALCGGGFITFSKNTASLVCDTFIYKEDIDPEKAREEYEGVMTKLENATNAREVGILKSAAKRLKLQLELAE